MKNIYREALESMVWQYGYRGVKDGKPMIWTGGMSALEEAFEALKWDDPHFIPDETGTVCDVAGCMEEPSCQGTAWPATGYWIVCSEHSQAFRDDKPQPEMKQRAIDREASRGPDGCLPVAEISQLEKE